MTTKYYKSIGEASEELANLVKESEMRHTEMQSIERKIKQLRNDVWEQFRISLAIDVRRED